MSESRFAFSSNKDGHTCRESKKMSKNHRFSNDALFLKMHRKKRPMESGTDESVYSSDENIMVLKKIKRRHRKYASTDDSDDTNANVKKSDARKSKKFASNFSDGRNSVAKEKKYSKHKSKKFNTDSDDSDDTGKEKKHVYCKYEKKFCLDDADKNSNDYLHLVTVKSQKFPERWSKEERLKGWLTYDEKKCKAICSVCDVELLPIRKTLIRHSLTEKHKLNMKVLESQAQIEKLKEVKSVTQDVNPPKFQKRWLEDEKFKGWLTYDEKKEKAVCSVCDVKLMPVHNTLISHNLSQKHELNMKVLESQAQIEKLKEVRSVTRDVSMSKFQERWLEEERFKGWLTYDIKKEKAICSVCYVELMPQRQTLICHSSSQKHKHKTEIQRFKENTNLTVKISDTVIFQQNVCAARVKLCAFLTEYGLPLSSCENLSKILESCFTDSEIAKNLQLTKAKCVDIAKAIGETNKQELIKKLRTPEVKFSIMIEFFSHNEFCIVLRYFDPSSKEIEIKFFELSHFDAENTSGKVDSEKVLDFIIGTLTKYEISLKNIMGLAYDLEKSKTFLNGELDVKFKERFNRAIVFQSTNEIFNYCAAEIWQVIPSYCEKLIRTIYFYLKNGANGRSEFSMIQKLIESEISKIDQKTERWISHLPLVECLLQQWENLTVYFNDDERLGDLRMAKEIYSMLENPFTKLYFLFLSYVLPKFKTLSSYFNRNEIIGTSMNRVTSTFKEILMCFMDHMYVQSTSPHLIDLSYGMHFLADSQMCLGVEIAENIQKIPKSESCLQKLTEFYANCREFLRTAACQMTVCYHFAEFHVIINEVVKNRRSMAANEVNTYMWLKERVSEYFGSKFQKESLFSSTVLALMEDSENVAENDITE